MWLSPSISSAVATFVAIWQNASAGVRMLIACQVRFSTSTIVLLSMSVIKAFACGQTFRAVRCLLFVEWRKLAASPGFAPGLPVSETGALLIMQRGNDR